MLGVLMRMSALRNRGSADMAIEHPHAPKQKNTTTERRNAFESIAKQFAKFGVVGGIAFVIDYALMIALTEVLSVPYIASATISFIISTIFNYLASMRYVFAHRDDISKRREFAMFVVLSVIGLLMNDALMALGTTVIGIDYRITKIGATGIVTIYNFISRRIFIDGQRDRKAP